MEPTRQRRAAATGCLSCLGSWFASPIDSALDRFRGAAIGRAAAVLDPLDDAWRSIVPPFDASLELARSGLPFHAVLERNHDRSPDPADVDRLLAKGLTLFLVQPHPFLPRLARLIVALRAAFLGPFRTPCSFLFLAGGTGREGMGLHHDGDVDSFWLQIEGRRTVTIGPPVAKGTPEEMSDRPRRAASGYRTLSLEPGSLFYMPPRTPHRVVCFERSLAVSVTWPPSDPREALRAFVGRERFSLDAIPDPLATDSVARLLEAASTRFARAAGDALAVTQLLAAGLAQWDVVPGRPRFPEPPAAPTSRNSRPSRRRPRRDPNRLWIVRPAIAAPLDASSRSVSVVAGDGTTVRLPASAADLACDFPFMPSLSRPGMARLGRGVGALVEAGIAAFHDLSLQIEPDDVEALDGWNFA